MKPLELATYIRFKTKTTTTTFTDAEMLPLVNFRQDELSRRLITSLSSDEDYFLTPQTTDLIADQRDYALPKNLLARIKRVEAKLDGENFIRLLPMDINEYRYVNDEDTIISYFSNDEGYAKYDMMRRSLNIYSGAITSVTGGLKIWAYEYPATITTLTNNTTDIEDDPTTTTYGFPRELHELLARGVIIDFKESMEKPIPLTEREAKFEYDLKLAINSLRNADSNREIIATVPVDNGEEY